MSDVQHTPTPWEKDRYGQLRGANGVPVNTKHLGISQSLGGGDNPEASANTAFIVKAVNAHEELVAALAMFIAWQDDTHDTAPAAQFDAAMSAARTALGKVAS